MRFLSIVLFLASFCVLVRGLYLLDESVGFGIVFSMTSGLILLAAYTEPVGDSSTGVSNAERAA